MTGDNSSVHTHSSCFNQTEVLFGKIPSLPTGLFQVPVLNKRLFQYIHKNNLSTEDMMRIPPAETGELAVWLYAGETQLFRDITFWKYLLDHPSIAFPEKTGSRILFFDCPTGEEYYSWEILRRSFFGSCQIKTRITTQLSYCAALIERRQLVFRKIAGLTGTLQHLTRDVQIMKYLENKYNQWHLTEAAGQNPEVQVCDCITPFPSHSFSVIFCRNRLIYYKENVCRIILCNLFRAIEPGGYLLAGTHDSPEMIKEAGFKTVEKDSGIYKKPL